MTENSTFSIISPDLKIGYLLLAIVQNGNSLDVGGTNASYGIASLSGNYGEPVKLCNSTTYHEVDIIEDSLLNNMLFYCIGEPWNIWQSSTTLPKSGGHTNT